MKRVIVCLLCLCCCVSCKVKNSITDDIGIPIVSKETPKEEIPEETTTVNTSRSLYSPNPTVSNATETDQYAILFGAMLIVPEEICGEDKWVHIIQVSMHSDKEKENRINELLMEQERWAEKYVGYEDNASFPTIYCHSSRYLSVMNHWWYLHNPPNSLYYYTTIDMQTGEKVRLDDLVEFNKEFILNSRSLFYPQ